MEISIKNFRLFEKQTNFKIKPLTILIGPNNSGKSSFTKFLMLLKNGYERLSFNKEGEHNLSSFDKELNRESETDELQLNFSISDNMFFSEKVEVSLTYYDGGVLKKGTILNGLISFQVSEDYSKIIEKDILNTFIFYDINFKTQDIIEFIKSNMMGVLLEKNKIWKFDFLNYPEVRSEKQKAENYYKKTEDFFSNHKIFELYETLCLSELYHELCEINAPYFFYDVYIDGKLDLKNQNLDNIQTIDLKDGLVFVKGRLNLDSKWFSEHFDPSDIENMLKRALDDKFDGIIESNNIEIKPSKLYDLLFNPILPIITDDDTTGASFIDAVAVNDRIFNNVFSDLIKISKNTYIPAKRGAQERYYKKSDFAFDVLKTYNENKNQIEDSLDEIFNGNEVVNFRKSVLDIFKIEGKLIIKEWENLQAVYIKKGNIEENLADLGLGFSQLIPLILFFHNLNSFDNQSTLIIEEPEANLHPSLQSKLADFFVLIINTFPNVNLVIETHSEYMVRKLQYLIARKELNQNDCVINYFNTSKKESIREPLVKHIEILDNGMLSDYFGPGFYDETTVLQVELMNLIKQQLN
jgi:predicted ATPase